MLPRVFFKGEGHVEQRIRVDGDDGRHFARVLRVKPGEPMVVAMTNGPWYGVVTEVTKDEIIVTLEKPYRTSEPRCRLLLVQGIAKGDKMETIVQKGTELGVQAFYVYQAHRSVVRIEGKVESKLARWEKVAREAAMQSQRDKIPDVYYASRLPQLLEGLAETGVGQFLVLDEAEEATGSVSALKSQGDSDTVRALFVGPEGGWSDEERAIFTSHPLAVLVTLGHRILRTETAGAAAVALTLAHFGDMGG